MAFVTVSRKSKGGRSGYITDKIAVRDTIIAFGGGVVTDPRFQSFFTGESVIVKVDEENRRLLLCPVDHDPDGQGYPLRNSSKHSNGQDSGRRSMNAAGLFKAYPWLNDAKGVHDPVWVDELRGFLINCHWKPHTPRK